MTFQSSNRRAHLGLALLGLVAAVCAAGDAQAQPVATRTVSYAGLDLTRAEGRAVLDRRLARAAETVCDAGRSGNFASLAGRRACAERALAEARNQAKVAAARQALARSPFQSPPGL
jgi:UrcA family protein